MPLTPLKSTLDITYKDNKKKLKTGTIIYGWLQDQERWQTKLHMGLTFEELNALEGDSGKNLPASYKELLTECDGG